MAPFHSLAPCSTPSTRTSLWCLYQGVSFLPIHCDGANYSVRQSGTFSTHKTAEFQNLNLHMMIVLWQPPPPKKKTFSHIFCYCKTKIQYRKCKLTALVVSIIFLLGYNNPQSCNFAFPKKYSVTITLQVDSCSNSAGLHLGCPQ
jgi:hypothetical protein